MNTKTRSAFLSKVVEGSTIAFTIDGKMKCGKVQKVFFDKDHKRTFAVRTKNCSLYYVPQDDFVWLKTGTHWPNGIHNAIQYDMGSNRT